MIAAIIGISKIFHLEGTEALFKRCQNQRPTSGDIRKDLDPVDLLRALIGVANVAPSSVHDIRGDWRQSARRLVDILITGSRPIQ